MALTRCGSHVSTRLFVRPRLGITTSLCRASPSTDGHRRRSPRYRRRFLVDGPRHLSFLPAIVCLHFSASTPASSLVPGPVLRSPHVSRIGYLVDDVRSDDGVHLISLS